MIRTLAGKSHAYRTLLLVVVLLLLAAMFRLPGLGALGFYGDEETTSFVARSVAEGDGFKMPSGLSYYRAAPLTVLNALAARVFGTEKELSYRLPSALLGLATPALLFLVMRTLVPTGVALAAAVLLVFSEWHVITSREARMYASFMLCFAATGFMIWHWANRIDVWKFLAISMGIAVTSTLNSLGLLLVMFPIIWICLQSTSPVPWRQMLAVTAVPFAFFFFVSEPLITGAFLEFRESFGSGQATASVSNPVEPTRSLLELTILAVPWAIGGLIGAWMGWRMSSTGERGGNWFNTASVLGASVITGATLVALHFYGAALAAATVVLLFQGRIESALKRARLPILVLAISAAMHFLIVHGTSFPAADLKRHFLFPYPYFNYFWQFSPGVVVLFWAGVAILAMDKPGRATDALKAAALVTIGILAGVGLAMQWGGMRYLIGAYPFMLLVAAYPLYRIYRIVEQRGAMARGSVGLMIAAILLSGALGGHGIEAAQSAKNISYGTQTSILSFGFPTYPDHKGAGEYVRDNSGDRDIVIAADALQMYWYIGRVSYWLTDASSSARFIYEDKNGTARDIYVNSQPLVSPKSMLSCSVTQSTIWMVTSAEKYKDPGEYLSDEQTAWFTDLISDKAPVFEGRDGRTMVYKLDCA